MSVTKSGVLPVPGASLSYKVRGLGPLLLIIAGAGGSGMGNWNGFIHALTDSYTVVTYDRRGALHSPLDAPVDNIPLGIHADDAHRLLAELSTEPVYVFGSSAGALIGLELVARYSEQVRTLVAHEPPAYYLLSDRGPSQESPFDLYRRVGAIAAMRGFMAAVGVNYEDREAGVEIPQMSEEEESSEAESFFKYNLGAAYSYRIDFEALSTALTRMVLAGGNVGRTSGSGGFRCAIAVKNRLHTDFVTFPSHHMGYLAYPKAFAEQLREVLDDKEGYREDSHRRTIE